MITIYLQTILPALAAISLTLPISAEESMDKMWGDRSAKDGVEGTKRPELFRDGNYGMFVHMGLYSHLGGQWKGKTYYGIGEWIKKLTYKGEGRPVWSVSTSEGVKIQNQQAASHVYKPYRTGILSFSKPGKHKVSVSLVEGDPAKSSLEAITFTPVR